MKVSYIVLGKDPDTGQEYTMDTFSDQKSAYAWIDNAYRSLGLDDMTSFRVSVVEESLKI